ncbi:MAG: hypothetical protein V1744_08055, partial [Candidatus Altiarchaeota archaeon]
CPYVPRCLNEWAANEAIAIINEAKPSSVLSGDLGVASQIRCREVRLDVSCNAFNDLDVSYYNRFGLIPIVSPELTFDEMGSFKDKRFTVYAHGRMPLMTTKYGLREGKLTDEEGYTFPIRQEAGHKQILNSVPLGMFSEILKLRDVGLVEYLLDLEENAAETVRTYRAILAGEDIKKPQGYTLGRYMSGVE